MTGIEALGRLAVRAKPGRAAHGPVAEWQVLAGNWA